MKTYVNPQGEEIPITIRSRTAQRWLGRLGYEYKDVRKDVFIDGHERLDVVEDRKNFLEKMEELKPYMVEFEGNGAMKEKIYPSDCAVHGPNYRPIIVITHDVHFPQTMVFKKPGHKKGIHFYDLKVEDKAS